MAKVGRPTKYGNVNLSKVTQLCRLGATDEELAEFLDIAVSTLNKWKMEYPEFMEAIKKGKIISDAKVVDSLYKRATGYKYNEQRIKSVGGEVCEEITTVKEVPPDPTACFFWLKNRRKQNWRDKQEIQMGNADDKAFKVEWK